MIDETNEVAERLIEKLERLRTTSAGVLRKKVYETLSALGADVSHLVMDARRDLALELELKAKRSSRRKKLLELRIEKNNVPPEKLLQARKALERAPQNIAAHKRALADVMSRKPPVWSTDPTPERRRHSAEAANEIVIVPHAGPVKATIAHRFKWPVDQLAHLLTIHEYQAAERCRDAYYNRMGHPKIGSYNDAGDQQNPARRLPITQTQERASREWRVFRDRIPRGLRPVIDNFVLEIPPRGAARPLSRAEFGKLYGRCKGDQQARGVSDGALRTACVVLAAVWAEYEDWLRQQRDRISRAASNDDIRALIESGAFARAAREIAAETRALASQTARGVAPSLALKWVESESIRRQVFGSAIVR